MQQKTRICENFQSRILPAMSGFHLMLAQGPIEIDHNIVLISDKAKHMAFKHSDWLETNYCMKIQNHLFTLVSQEPL